MSVIMLAIKVLSMTRVWHRDNYHSKSGLTEMIWVEKIRNSCFLLVIEGE
jgi:hypothetical protein